MVFNNFVEIGRVCQINYGPEAGKLATIVNVLDQNKVLVDGPHGITGVARHVVNIKRISLTSLKVNIPVGAREGTIKKQFEKDSVMTKWAESSKAKRAAKKALRANMSDFDRFKLMVARKQKARIIRKKISELKKSA